MRPDLSAHTHVLVVEDDVDFASLIEEVFRIDGAEFTIRSVGTLADAIQSIQKAGADLILLDLGLPDSEGSDTFTRVAALAPEVPVVVLTGMNDSGTELRTVRQGAQDYIVKGDFDPRQLVRIARHARERGNLTRALREKTEQFRLLVNELPIVIWSTDADMRVTTSAGAALPQFDLDTNQLVGTLLADYMGDDNKAIEYTRRVLAGESVHYEVEWQGRLLLTFQEPVHNAHGDVVGSVGLSIDVTDQRQKDIQLAESMSKLRTVSARLNGIKEQERSRIARDVHDHLGQALTALKMDVAEVRRRIASGDVGGADNRLNEMSALIDTAVSDVRRVATELRPVIFDDLGLIAAIQERMDDIARRSPLRCNLHTNLRNAQLPDDQAIALYRILQEALTNVVRHARATAVEVSLIVSNSSVRLKVADNGCGIPPPHERGARTLGLIGMRDRAFFFGGDVTVEPNPGGGTTVTAEWPIHQE